MDAIIFCYNAEVYAMGVTKSDDGGYDSKSYFVLDCASGINQRIFKRGGFAPQELEGILPIEGT